MPSHFSTSASTQASSISLSSLPEELLERVLNECITSLVASNRSSHYPSSPYPTSTDSPTVSPSHSKGGSPCTSPLISSYVTPAETPAVSPSRSRPTSPVLLHPNGGLNHQSSTTLPSSSVGLGPKGVASNGTVYSSSVLAPLLVSSLFHRISSPLLYRLIMLSSRSQTQKLLEGSLRRHPERARWVRRLVIMGIWEGAGEVLKLIAAANSTLDGTALSQYGGKGKGREAVIDEDQEGWPIVGLEALEVTIDLAPLGHQRPTPSPAQPNQQQPAGRPRTNSGHAGSAQAPGATQDVDAEEFCAGLLAFAGMESNTSSLKRLVVRKPQNVYLTHQRTKTIVNSLAKVVESSAGLETTHIAFRLSDDPVPAGSRRASGSSPVPSIPASSPSPPPGPVAVFSHALARSPSLHTLITHLPSVWNESLLRMSTNGALKRIVLLGGGGRPVSIYREWRDNLGAASMSQTGSLSPVSPQVRALPSNPVERVYAASTRGCDGYAIGVAPIGPTNPLSPSAAVGRTAMGTGFFLNEARKHERLCTLINTGSMVEDEEASPAIPFIVQGQDARSRQLATMNSVPRIAIPTPGSTKGSSKTVLPGFSYVENIPQVQ